ncbi:hypothetical protein K435DRAFT_846747 [Dendrothele bispora CBS 962.96]|uniref:Uncharacterized protein n=1 Tax=Dendrothele bispora (strain CBS 962.96) TaxID=1314807 RepID=A0A4S8KKR7_DENBC|nr:hypothetical protein K435DRAFT_846747 [Dendrothele bispora CBS 962.96]
MNAFTTNLQNLQPSLNLSSQPDNTQSGVTESEIIMTRYTGIPVVLYTLSFTVILLVIRLRYPCLTLSELRKFMDELNDTVQKCTAEGQRRDFMDCVSGLQRQIDGIEYEWSRKAIFRWSSVYGYLHASLIAVRNIVKCYDQAQALRVSALHHNVYISTRLTLQDVIVRERRVREDIENQYHHTLNSEENRRRDTIADADTGSSGWVTSLLQGFRILGQGDQ